MLKIIYAFMLDKQCLSAYVFRSVKYTGGPAELEGRAESSN
jgi:hypothetical protein